MPNELKKQSVETGELMLATTNEQLPEFMQDEKALGTEDLGKYVVPPRVKVMQGNRASQYQQFKEGSVVLTPVGLVVAEAGDPFWFIPLIFYPEYCVVNPIKLKGQLPMIRERTLDPTSDIAAISRDPERRKSLPCPENRDLTLSYVEYLTFICVIVRRPEVAGLPVAMSFSGAEHKIGSQLASLIKMRNAPICGCVFEGYVPKNKRENAQGSWYGVNVGNPMTEGGPSPFVQSKAEFDVLKEKHLELKGMLHEQLIKVQYDEDEEEKQGSSAPSEAAASM